MRESLNQPLLLIFEDLHWIDTETQGFLDTLSESVASANVLLLVNYRPEYRHEWGQKTYYTQVRLAPLGKAEAAALLTFLLGSEASVTALTLLILEKTEGTPFFIEEVVQTLEEEGALTGKRGHYRLAIAPTALHIPPTVQGVLAARIDRLAAEEKALLQHLSVIGRQFPLSLIQHVVTQPEAELYRVLSSLQAKEFLYEQPAFPEMELLFKHALTQDVAYGTLLQEQRKALHEKTARAIEGLHKESLDEHYHELAHHYSRSENTEKAVAYLHLAGQQALQRSANEEAARYLRQGLDLLQALPDTPERSQQEIRLQVVLGVGLMATLGYSAPEVGAVYRRAHELCREMDETPQLFPVLWGLWAFYVVRADHKKARELGEQLLHLAQPQPDSGLLLEAHYALGTVLIYLGEFAAARAHLEQGSGLYDTRQHHALAFSYGSADPGVMCLGETAWVLWHLGYPEQALQKSHATLTLAHDLAHPASQALALLQDALLRLFRREGQAAQDRTDALIIVSTEQGFSLSLAMATILRGWALTEQGNGGEGLSQLREGLAAEQATGAEIYRSLFLASLAEAYGQSGEAETGLTIVSEALAFVAQTQERWHEAELHRLQGELLLQRSPDNHPEAEACFQRALDVAGYQHAKSWQLRAATSLARLWQQQGRRTEARELLSPVYEWFTEGFDTADLKDAKSLLDTLSR